jgi:hypothetical protein
MNSKKNEWSITVDNGPWRPSKIIVNYLGACTAGFGYGVAMGSTTGAFLGGAVGFTAVASSPFIIGVTMFRMARKVLRK